jgi:hypothetical protein
MFNHYFCYKEDASNHYISVDFDEFRTDYFPLSKIFRIQTITGQDLVLENYKLDIANMNFQDFQKLVKSLIFYL